MRGGRERRWVKVKKRGRERGRRGWKGDLKRVSIIRISF